jgi:hypothetical protein
VFVVVLDAVQQQGVVGVTPVPAIEHRLDERAGDVRGTRVNAMLDASCGRIVGSLEELLEKLSPIVFGESSSRG